MAKYRLVIDTNIYRKNPRRDNLPFSALSRLCKVGVVKLFIPHLVLREFQSQQSIQSKKNLTEIVAAARSLEKIPGVPKDLMVALSQLSSQLAAREDEVAVATETEFQNWADNLEATVVDLSADQARAAMEAYFTGAAPLKSPKTRNDIPDSLIFQSVRSLAGKPLTLVSEDNNFRSACAEIENVTVFSALEDLIESDGVQNELKELDVIDNIGSIVEALKAFDEETGELVHAVAQGLGEALMWKTITARSIPDDNHEATISGYYEAEDVELDFEQVSYFGSGEFGIPFTTKVVVTGIYYLFKGDVYEAENRQVSLTDHNDHYYEAEEEFEIYAPGLLKVTCNRDAIDLTEIDGAIESVSLDAVGPLRLTDD